MKKLFITILIILVTKSLFSQGLELGLGFANSPSALSEKSETFLNFDMGFFSDKIHFYLGFDFATQFKTKGEYYQGWNQFPDDITETGIEWNIYNLVAGYYNKNIVFAGILGAGVGREYHNCMDESQILAENGKWYETNGAESETNFNIGVKFKYFIPTNDNTLKIPISLSLTNNYFGASIGIGIIFSPPYLD